MGYRSNVAAMFYVSGEKYESRFPALKLFFTENFPFNDWDVEEFKNSSAQGFKFVAEDVKWYEGYDDVSKFGVFVEGYKRVGEGLDWYYEFLRIGEDYDDVDTDSTYNCDRLLSLHRVIHFDV